MVRTRTRKEPMRAKDANGANLLRVMVHTLLQCVKSALLALTKMWGKRFIGPSSPLLVATRVLPVITMQKPDRFLAKNV